MSAPIDQLPPHQPNYDDLDAVLRNTGRPSRVPLIELFADREFMHAALASTPAAMFPNYEPWQQDLLLTIEYTRRIGQDAVTVGIDGMNFQYNIHDIDDTADLSKGQRAWFDESTGPITSRQTFDTYPWPDQPPSTRAIDFVAEHLPDGMGIIGTTPGVFETTCFLMGYEHLALAVYDDPELVHDISDRVGQRMQDAYTLAANHPAVRALWLGDDLGFKTATLLSPDQLRQYIFPWQAKLVAAAHNARKPFMFHSCGQLGAVMDDLIDTVGIDARHSFEDIITPVADFHAKYSHRIAILGGADVDVLCRAPHNAIRPYCRNILNHCAPSGRFAMGTGNTVTNYIPVDKYLLLVDELARYNSES